MVRLAEAALTPHWPLSERRPATPEAEHLGWNGLFRVISWTWEDGRLCASCVEPATAWSIQALAWRSPSHPSVQAWRRRDLFSSAKFRGL